jgi:glutathione S-transferase
MLGLEYERVPIDIFAGDTLTCEYASINPLRETPVLELEDGSRIAQSSAILWYLAEGTPFLPSDVFGRACVVQWLAFEQERVMGGLGGPRFRALTGRSFDPARLDTGREALQVLDDHLSARPWVVGSSVSIADLGLFPYVSRSPDAGVELPGHVLAWMGRVRGVQGFVDDFVQYPDNARPGIGSSIYG